ncbi:MAG: hypothetical protein P8Y60_08660 [Calditrichota bacterium]
MLRKICVVLPAIILIFLSASNASAQLDVTGFFDVQYAKPSDQKDVFSGFQYGQFEIDLSAKASERLTMEGALALNPDEQKFEPGIGYLQLDLSPTSPSRRDRRGGAFVKEFGFQFGQFDVPFGLDYQVIPSVDRSLVHVPLMNRRSIDSWNSIGMNMYARCDQWNFVGFIVNGITEDYTAGGRIGLKPDPGMEVGISYARGASLNGLQPTEIVGADLQGLMRQFSWKAEANFSRGILNGEASLDSMDAQWGYYFHGKYDFFASSKMPMFLVARYGRWMPLEGFQGQQLHTEQQITIGVGAKVAYQSQIRLEYLTNVRDPGELTFQFVVGF